MPTPSRDAGAHVVELQHRVRDHGLAIITLLGVDKPNPSLTSINVVPCANAAGDLAKDGTYHVSGGWQVDLPPERHVPAIRAVRDRWQAHNYRITDYREFADDTRASLGAVDPSTGYRFSIDSTKPPTGTKHPVAAAIHVTTPCFRPPDGEFPYDVLDIRE